LNIALSKRPFTAVYLLALVALAVVGCTSREDPSEVLITCGNHSCGELIMVTTDTSSEGFKYLDPQLSPAGDWIVTLSYFNYESDAWRVADIPFTINADDGSEIAVGDFENSDCLPEPTAVPEEERPDFLSWTVLKARYR
jgi:hypothetical protein